MIIQNYTFEDLYIFAMEQCVIVYFLYIYVLDLNLVVSVPAGTNPLSQQIQTLFFQVTILVNNFSFSKWLTSSLKTLWEPKEYHHSILKVPMTFCKQIMHFPMM